jgi:HPt (histidine-containing phosphotransfer) domain-containing protein
MPDVIDRAVFHELQQTAGADFVVELVDTFFSEAPQMFAELRAALSSRATDRFRRAAHSLKTNAATFGATALAGEARGLELGGLPPDAGAIDALQSVFDVAAQALKELAHG